MPSGLKSRSKKRLHTVLRAPQQREKALIAGNAGSALSVPSSHKNWLFAAGLAIAVFLVYQPAWHGALIWDDDGHITRIDLRSWHGLYRIWFDLGATQQYYPLLHSAFWFEHKLWGDDPLGYHLINFSLHVTAALLAVSLLRRLAIPGAWLAGAIFALHPVQVESVAWITELKNTLSTVFYLSAAIAYFRFDESPKLSWYLAAIGLFILGLLSKTVVATLPAALLVIIWLQRGRISWMRDVVPLLPFFLIGAIAGIFTAWVERTLIGAEGADFGLSLVDRCLIAGREIWFYLGRLFWPADLIFIYPRWQISNEVWWQYLYPAAALVLLASLWRLRHRTRAPLAAMLFFVGTLFPVLGFLNVYPFLFSFVADHFQYLASLGIITIFSAGVALLLKRAKGWERELIQVGCVVLLGVLAIMSWRQSRMYADVESLYTATIKSNPESWLAHNNLGAIYVERGRIDDAIVEYKKVLEIKPDYGEAHFNLAVALGHRGRIEEAIVHYVRVLEIMPGNAVAHFNLGTALADRGDIDEAIAHYRKALEIKPDYANAHNNLGEALAGRREFRESILHYRKTLEAMPDNVKTLNNLSAVLLQCGEFDEAIVHAQKAVKIKPDYAEAHFNLGLAYSARRQLDEALKHYQKAFYLASESNNIALAIAIQEQIVKLQQ